MDTTLFDHEEPSALSQAVMDRPRRQNKSKGLWVRIKGLFHVKPKVDPFRTINGRGDNYPPGFDPRSLD